MDEATLAALADKQAITEQLYRYCRAVDRLDVPLGRSVFHEDSHADYGAGYYRGPGPAVIDLICEQHRALSSHSHQVSNMLIELAGDEAASETYVTATLTMPAGEAGSGRETLISVRGRYVDRWARRQGRWAIAHRTVVFDHQHVAEVQAIPGTGTPGTRAPSDPSFAVLKGQP